MPISGAPTADKPVKNFCPFSANSASSFPASVSTLVRCSGAKLFTLFFSCSSRSLFCFYLFSPLGPSAYQLKVFKCGALSSATVKWLANIILVPVGILSECSFFFLNFQTCLEFFINRRLSTGGLGLSGFCAVVTDEELLLTIHR